MAGDRQIILAGEDGEVRRYSVVSETGGRTGRPVDAKRYSESYVVVFQAALRALSEDRRVKLVQFRVLMAHLGRASYENPVWDAEPKVVGAALGMDPAEVSRNTSLLVAWGYLIRPAPGKLQLPPRFAWRGSVAGRERAVKDAGS